MTYNTFRNNYRNNKVSCCSRFTNKVRWFWILSMLILTILTAFGCFFPIMRWEKDKCTIRKNLWSVQYSTRSKDPADFTYNYDVYLKNDATNPDKLNLKKYYYDACGCAHDVEKEKDENRRNGKKKDEKKEHLGCAEMEVYSPGPLSLTSWILALFIMVYFFVQTCFCCQHSLSHISTRIVVWSMFGVGFILIAAAVPLYMFRFRKKFKDFPNPSHNRIDFTWKADTYDSKHKDGGEFLLYLSGGLWATFAGILVAFWGSSEWDYLLFGKQYLFNTKNNQCPLQCPRCHFSNHFGSQFCSQCGNQLPLEPQPVGMAAQPNYQQPQQHVVYQQNVPQYQQNVAQQSQHSGIHVAHNNQQNPYGHSQNRYPLPEVSQSQNVGPNNRQSNATGHPAETYAQIPPPSYNNIDNTAHLQNEGNETGKQNAL